MNYPRWLGALTHLNRITEVWRCFLVFRHPVAVLTRYLCIGTRAYPFALQTRKGSRLDITSFHDLVTAWIIFCRDEYGMPASVRTVLDIGANFGAFSLWAIERAPAASIVTIEPFPDCFSRLRQHVETNKLTGQIATWNIGLGQHSQDRFISDSRSGEIDFPSQSRAFVGETTEAHDSIRVSVLSMDDLVARTCLALNCDEIDFVKLDIEGVEHAVITADAVNALKRIRNLSMEYHPNGSRDTLFTILASAGLSCTSDIPAGDDSGVARFARDRGKQ